jgi:hypothetical protein
MPITPCHKQRRWHAAARRAAAEIARPCRRRKVINEVVQRYAEAVEDLREGVPAFQHDTRHT